MQEYYKTIGGKKHWEDLQSRKVVEELKVYSNDSFTEVIDRTLNYTNYYQKPGNYLRSWTDHMFFFVRAYSQQCNWYYSDRTMSLSFFDKEFNIKETGIPQIGVLKILTFPMKDSVIIESNSYRIDFEDVLWDRTMSVYFDKSTHLITKHTYQNSGESILHEYYYKNYKNKEGYMEPYVTENYVDGSKFKVITVKDIYYNIEIDSNIFLPPAECNQETYEPIKLNNPLRISP